MKKTSVVYCAIIVLFLAITNGAGAAPSGVLSGKWITKENGPMTGGQVLLFNVATGPAPASNKFLRIPDAGAAIDSEGKFSAGVPAGKYYLVMRKRLDPTSAGPPQEGDPQYYARLENGKPRAYTVKNGKTTDIGTVTVAEPFRREPLVTTNGLTGIEGTVTDDQGQPVAKVRAFAYSSPEMKGRPLYASAETGADGKYFLNVTKKGTYYLKVRTHYGGGKPEDGEFMGIYGKHGSPDTVTVESGKIRKEMDIQVTKMNIKRKKE
ncbi:MAG TPA: carboxypeptidase-like regulatory domain-containing protein [Desulfuromonadaceae bacterium]